MENRTALEERIDHIQRDVTKLEVGLGKLAEKTDADFKALNAKIDSVSEKLNAKIDGVGEKLSANIDALKETVAGMKSVQSMMLWSLGIIGTGVLAMAARVFQLV